MIILMDEMTSFFQGWFDKFRYANKAANELYQLTDEELKDLELTRMDIPYVSQMSALKND
jgi:uncharacterized protein YjiS (DUF1127 family)